MILTKLHIFCDSPENGTFHEHLIATEGDRRAKILDDETTTPALSLDKTSGSSGFESKEEFLFGNIGMKIKLAPTDGAGTVSTYYVRYGSRKLD